MKGKVLSFGCLLCCDCSERLASSVCCVAKNPSFIYAQADIFAPKCENLLSGRADGCCSGCDASPEETQRHFRRPRQLSFVDAIRNVVVWLLRMRGRCDFNFELDQIGHLCGGLLSYLYGIPWDERL